MTPDQSHINMNGIRKWHMKHINVNKDEYFINNLQTSLDKDNQLSTWDLFMLTYQAELTNITPDFKGLRAIEHLPHVDFLSHQLDSAKQAIEEMNGRAILADEVGLGKTIEAGLILKEYMIRGLVKKVLIHVPASLVNQWVSELTDRFYIPAIAFCKNYSWDKCNEMVSSIDSSMWFPHLLDILYYVFIILII